MVRLSKADARRRNNGYDPRRWSVWSLRRPVLAYLLVVEVLALVIVGVTVTLVPVTPRSLFWFGLLLFGEIAHLETARGIERIRELGADGRPHMHLQSIWIFAALLLLPPPLVAVVIAVSYTHSWVRVYRRRSVLHRKVFSAATVLLACAAAGVVLHAGTGGHLGPYMQHLDGFGGMVTLVIAGGVYFLVNYAMVVAVIIATNPANPGRTALGNLSDVLIVNAAVGVGAGIALVVTVRPWLLPVLAATPLALHLGLLLPQFQTAARTDSKTALLDPSFWTEVARRELVRAERLGSTLGILIIDIDHFKEIDDNYGHLAGDEVLRAVAAAIRDQVRGGDFVGRYGGDEFAVLLPGTAGADLIVVADRIRAQISRVNVSVHAINCVAPRPITGLTASIGAASYPDTATELTPLLLAADQALYDAKATGRNHTVAAT
ncbi:diguanylate cyclase (GGDEF)-like protein [Actinocrispum wychmicini]|uniref:Diguanylate cyclase (GGDEF)-like protein n=1 Tax=Actinocrispum wychmicini TaxID=1213861 RepID=A0A4R2JL88_9PSEU|nr:diguanylate cyclase (GGDEF)-like protein [Actinocrispum wychmicini]